MGSCSHFEESVVRSAARALSVGLQVAALLGGGEVIVHNTRLC